MRFWTVLVLLGATISSGVARGQSVFGDADRGRPDRSYDVLNYRINISFDEEQKKVFGTTAIRLRPFLQNIDSVQLDAADMAIQSVTMADGKILRYDNRSPHLAIHLDHPYTPSDTFTVVVEYACTPKKGLYFMQPDSSHPKLHRQIWTQGEDMDNHYWFPCYDFPNEKATSEVIATVPEEFTVLSNGRLVKETHDAGHRTRTFDWREEKPHASYLIMLVAGKYSIVKDTYRNLSVTYYMYPEDAARAKLIYGRTPEMLKIFEAKIGFRFPWEKYSQVFIDDFMWGGMENTTAVTMNTALLVDARSVTEMSPDPTIAHELAHQWWGDVVTCRDWSHLWLNEGFATYFERVYDEAVHGEDAFQYGMVDMARNVRMTDRTMGRKPIVSKESYPGNIYSRGGWVLHMLRDVLGETAFWNALHEYIVRHQFGSVETRELELAIQDATGQNLDWFFREWVYGAGYPRLLVKKTWRDSAAVLDLSIEQTQTRDSLTGVFTFPLNIECAGNGWSATQRIWMNRVDSTYSIPLRGRPEMVIVDKGYHVLKDMDYECPREELLYVLQHARDVADRIRAVLGLEKWQGDTGVVAAISRCATGDPFWGVRRSAVNALGELKGDTALPVLEALLRTDPDGRVRSSAARALESRAGSGVAGLLENTITSDSSYLVIGSSLRALAKVDSVRGFKAAVRCLSEESYRDIIKLSSIGTLRSLGSPKAIGALATCTTPENSIEVRDRAIAAIGALGKNDSTAFAVISAAVNDGDVTVRRAATRDLITWGGQGP